MSPEVVEQFLSDYTNAMKMHYGQAMVLTGFDPDVIVAVQREVAVNMNLWLDAQRGAGNVNN